MNWFKNLKILSKLLISFVIIALISVAIGYIGISNIKYLQEKDKFMYDNPVLAMRYLGEANIRLQQARVNVFLEILANTPDKIAEFKKIREGHTAVIGEVMKECEKTIFSDEERELLNRFLAVRANYLNMIENSEN